MPLYDGEGCLSLRVLFIERGANVSPSGFCQMRAMRSGPSRRFSRDGISDRRLGWRWRAIPRASGCRRASKSLATLVELFVALGSAARRAAASASARVKRLFRRRSARSRYLYAPPRHRARSARGRVPRCAARGPRSKLGRVADRHVRLASSPAACGVSRGRPRIAEFVRWVTDERGCATWSASSRACPARAASASLRCCVPTNRATSPT